MATFSFAISAGHNVASPTNVESIVSNPPHILPDQLATYTGSVKRRTIGGSVQRNGAVKVVWTWDLISRADFNTLITAVFGGFTSSSAAVTIVTLDETNQYARFNAYADKPHPNEDYTIATGGAYLLDVRLTLFGLISIGEHTYEFTEEFTK